MSKKRQRYPNTDSFMSYSGDKSKSFWQAVNDLANDADRQELYSLGVALQNFESYVLKQLQFKITHENSEVCDDRKIL